MSFLGDLFDLLEESFDSKPKRENYSNPAYGYDSRYEYDLGKWKERQEKREEKRLRKPPKRRGFITNFFSAIMTIIWITIIFNVGIQVKNKVAEMSDKYQHLDK